MKDIKKVELSKEVKAEMLKGMDRWMNPQVNYLAKLLDLSERCEGRTSFKQETRAVVRDLVSGLNLAQEIGLIGWGDYCRAVNSLYSENNYAKEEYEDD